jgi:hypothetical protein
VASEKNVICEGGLLPFKSQCEKVKAFPAAHRHVIKNFNVIMEETEKLPD